MEGIPREQPNIVRKAVQIIKLFILLYPLTIFLVSKCQPVPLLLGTDYHTKFSEKSSIFQLILVVSCHSNSMAGFSSLWRLVASGTHALRRSTSLLDSYVPLGTNYLGT